MYLVQPFDLWPNHRCLSPLIYSKGVNAESLVVVLDYQELNNTDQLLLNTSEPLNVRNLRDAHSFKFIMGRR
jgi:hypothetical protein